MSKLRKIQIVFFVLCASDCFQASAGTLLQRRLSDGSAVTLEESASVAPENGARAGRQMVRCTLYSQKTQLQQSRNPIWSREFPRSLIEDSNAPAFQAFDMLPTKEGVLLCYKVDGTTFSDFAPFDSGTRMNQLPLATELNRDHYGGISIGAHFATTNGEQAVFLHLKNVGTHAWVREGEDWGRAKRYDFAIPSWARPIDIRKISGQTRNTMAATEAPDAHWGAIKDGIQLGISLTRSNFQTGQEMIAMVHVKNVGTQPVPYKAKAISCSDGPIEIMITDEAGKPLSCKNPLLASLIGSQGETVEPNSQNLHPQRLDGQFDFLPGSYTVQARLKIPSASGDVVAASAKTPIFVVPAAH